MSAYGLCMPWVTRKGQDPCLNCRHPRSSGARGALPSFTHSVPPPWLCSRVDALILGTTETNYRGILLLKSNTSLEMKVHHSPGLCWGPPSRSRAHGGGLTSTRFVYEMRILVNAHNLEAGFAGSVGLRGLEKTARLLQVASPTPHSIRACEE